MKLKYRISSVTSEHPGYPASNLSLNKNGWQSAKFPVYPQQITLMFYQPVKINRMKIIVHHHKISQKIKILYHLPTQGNHNNFTKLGFISFKQPNQKNKQSFSQENKQSLPQQNPQRQIKQLKVLNNLQVECQFVRLILQKNHSNKSNFFNQVALSQIVIQGIQDKSINSLSPLILKNDSQIKVQKTIKDKVNLLNQFKSKCIIKEQYHEANQIKLIISQIHQKMNHIRQYNQIKLKMIKDEKFLDANQIKKHISSIRQQIQQMSNNFYDPIKNTVRNFHIKPNQNQALYDSNKINKTKITKNNQNYDNQFMKEKDNQIQNNSIIQESQNTDSIYQQNKSNQQNDNNEIEHSQRIVPALLNKIKNTQKNNQIEELNDSHISQILPTEPEQMSPSNEANSSLLSQFYDKTLIKKLYSRHWQFKQQALDAIVEDCKKQIPQNINKIKLRSFIFIFNLIISKQSSKQLLIKAIELMNCISQLRISDQQFKTQLSLELQKSVMQILDKAQQNTKVKGQAEKAILRMIDSPIFGRFTIYHAIVKAYSDKVSSKLKSIYLQNLSLIINKGNNNNNININQNSNINKNNNSNYKGDNKEKHNIPFTIVDFTVKKVHDPNNEVRKCAINLLKTLKNSGYQDRIKICLSQQSNLKQAYLKQIGLQ